LRVEQGTDGKTWILMMATPERVHSVAYVHTEADANRLRETWNGCDGLANPSAIPDVVAALRELLPMWSSSGIEEPHVRRARAALAKAEGRRT